MSGEQDRDTEYLERVVQLGVGVAAFGVLCAFLYMELRNPDIIISDRTFWLLAGITGSALALRGIQEASNAARRGRDLDYDHGGGGTSSGQDSDNGGNNDN